jgi:hypothetical protein
MAAGRLCAARLRGFTRVAQCHFVEAASVIHRRLGNCTRHE